MEAVEVTLAERGQIVIPKEVRDELGLKPGSRLQVRVEGGRLVIEKRVQLDLSRWIGKAVDDGLTTDQALAELRGRPVPWNEDAAGKQGKQGIQGKQGKQGKKAVLAAAAAPAKKPARQTAKSTSASMSRATPKEAL